MRCQFKNHHFPLGFHLLMHCLNPAVCPLKSLMSLYKIVVCYKWLYNNNQCWSMPDHRLLQNLLYNHLSIEGLFFLFWGNVEVYCLPRLSVLSWIRYLNLWIWIYNWFLFLNILLLEEIILLLIFIVIGWISLNLLICHFGNIFY